MRRPACIQVEVVLQQLGLGLEIVNSNPEPITCALQGKAASVQIGFVDRFTGALVIQGSVASVEEALRYTVKALHDVLGFAACETTKS